MLECCYFGPEISKESNLMGSARPLPVKYDNLGLLMLGVWESEQQKISEFNLSTPVEFRGNILVLQIIP
jgi:hypothetical protein